MTGKVIWKGKAIGAVSAFAFIAVTLAVGMMNDGENMARKLDGFMMLLALVLTALLAGKLYDRVILLSRDKMGFQLLVEELEQKLEQKLEELEKLADSEGRFRSMLERLPDPVFLFAGEKLLFCNPAGKELAGPVGAGGIPYTGFCERFHPEERKAREWLQQSENGQDARIETLFRGRDGRYTEWDCILSRSIHSGNSTVQIILHDFTKKKRMEGELQEAEREAAHILEYHQGLTFKFTRNLEGDYIYTLWAGTMAHELGLSPGRVVGSTPHDLLSPEVAEELISYYNTAWEERKKVAFEMNVGEKVCMIILSPFHSMDGREEIVGHCMDISERKKTEAELLRLREMLESFFNNTTDAIGVSDLSGRIIHTNQAFVDMFGWPLDECAGLCVLEVVPPDLHEELRNFHEAVEYGGHISGYETKRKKKNGVVFDVSVTISPIRNMTGNTVAIAAISRDITENKLVEAALRKSETKYRLIAENMTDIVAVLNCVGRIDYISPSCKAMLGTDPDDLVGHSIFEVLQEAEDNSPLGVFFKNSLEAESGEVAELRIKHPDGQCIILEVSSRWMPDLYEGDLPNILMVARDISERKKAEEMLLKSEKLSVVGQLAAGVAHEIRNPLTSLKGFLQLLQKRTSENGFFFELMLSELDRVNNIVSEFLVLSKPQAVKMETRNLVQIVQMVVAFLSSQALLSNVEIVSCIKTEPEALVTCDENQLKQVFINLLKNAVEAMPGGGVVTVTLLYSGKNSVMIRFEDQGHGIPEERLAKLGEPFYTTKEKGTGLGLMVSFRIIEDHGGTIRVTSQVGAGTTFEVELPLV